MSDQLRLLSVEDLVAIATRIGRGDPAIRDLGLLQSAAARPGTSVFGADAYPDLATKAAAMLESIVRNHALVDGNKRLGWLATAVFLELNGFNASKISNDDVYDLVIWIASTNASLEDITTQLSRLLARRRRR